MRLYHVTVKPTKIIIRTSSKIAKFWYSKSFFSVSIEMLLNIFFSLKNIRLGVQLLSMIFFNIFKLLYFSKMCLIFVRSISNRCIVCGFMPNSHKKSWMVSTTDVFLNMLAKMETLLLTHPNRSIRNCQGWCYYSTMNIRNVLDKMKFAANIRIGKMYLWSPR